MSKVNLNRSFPSKEELIEELCCVLEDYDETERMRIAVDWPMQKRVRVGYEQAQRMDRIIRITRQLLERLQDRGDD